MTLATILHLKRKMWTASRILSGLGREPSHELDVAGDAYIDALEAYRMAVQEAWGARCDRRLDASLAQMQLEHKEGRIGQTRVEVMA